MEDNHILKALLETLFSSKELKSWTCHDNQNGSTVTLRFVDLSAATRGSQSEPKTTTYRQKSRKQIARDKERLENFNTRVKTRSQTEIEVRRQGDESAEQLEESNLSPASSVFSIPSQSSVLDIPGISPALNQASGYSRSISPQSSTVQSLETFLQDDIPACDKIPKKLKLRDSADRVDSELFYEHISKRSDIEYDNIKCHQCPAFMRSISIEGGLYRLMYCEQCDVYICTRCRPPPDTGTLTHSSSCDSAIYFVT